MGIESRTLYMFSMVSILFLALVTHASTGPKVCGVVEKAEHGTQLIPSRGVVKTRLNGQDPVPCGSMIMTREGVARVRLEDRTVIQLAPGSFVEIQGGGVRSLYRGEMLVSGPALNAPVTWTSPNSMVEYKGGVFWVQYQPSDRSTSLAVFNRKVRFFNRFNRDAHRDVQAGELSKMIIQQAWIRPSQPEIISHTVVAPMLVRFGLPAEEVKEWVSIVKQIHDSRSEALASEIEDWNEASAEEPTRSPASAGVGPRAAVDVLESEFVMARLRDRLFGKPADVAKVENDRKPASRAVPPVFSDEEYVVHRKRLKSEIKRIGKEIDSIRTESSEE
jgi:hypothetical protein